MQRHSKLIIGVLLAGGLIFVLLTRRSQTPPEPPPSPAPTSTGAPTSSPLPDAGPSAESASAPEVEAPTNLEALFEGGVVPPLPKGTPKQVRFGVTLVTYSGAQGAPKKARSKTEALKLARELATLAQTDFKAAVAKGDSGSTMKAGRIPQGILEPEIEYMLFTLKKGQVLQEPLDTPRGYWVPRRY